MAMTRRTWLARCEAESRAASRARPTSYCFESCVAAMSLACFVIIDIKSRDDITMATVTVRNLPAEVHRALRLRAAAHGVSTEAEIRAILAQAVRSDGGLRVGTELRRYAEAIGGVELEVRRDPAPIEPAFFE